MPETSESNDKSKTTEVALFYSGLLSAGIVLTNILAMITGYYISVYSVLDTPLMDQQ